MKHVAPDRIRLARWHENALYLVVGLLTLSGLVWVVCHYILAEEGEYGPMPHAWEGPMMNIHGAAAMLVLFFIGSLLTVHMIKAWRARRNRWSGGGMAALCVLLTATGYGLYYVGDDTVRAWLSWAHWLPGVAMPVLLAVHVYFGVRKAKAKPRHRRKVPTRATAHASHSHPTHEVIH
jgi:hypothetical protein